MARIQYTVLYFLLIVLLGIFAISGWVLTDYWLDSRAQRQGHEQLRELVWVPEPEQKELPPFVTVTDPEARVERMVLREYAAFYARNGDFWGCAKPD